MDEGKQVGRGAWGSRLGFVLAAAGSAVGLGNIWKFPYITGENGGGLFVFVYLLCIAFIGLPVMIGEILIGRRTQASPVAAYDRMSGHRRMWRLVGWMGVSAGALILSFYSVVGGWAMHYVVLALQGTFAGASPEQIGAAFGEGLLGSTWTNVAWHTAFMAIAVGIVLGGVHRGIESAAKILMPTLFVLLVVLLGFAMQQDGFSEAASFVFAPSAENLTAGGVLEALGHAFFTLSLGLGTLITYGSYLAGKDDVVTTSATISVLDTGVALVSCLIIFPIIFTFGMEPGAGPGLVFVSMPIAFGSMKGGLLLGAVFFFLLLFAAVTSAISMLEPMAATFIDSFGWKRRRATWVIGGSIYLLGIACALSMTGHLGWWTDIFGKSVFDSIDYITSNWFLPLGGLAVAVFMGWVVPEEDSREEFGAGSRFAALYPLWRFLLRYVAPVAIVCVIGYLFYNTLTS